MRIALLYVVSIVNALFAVPRLYGGKELSVSSSILCSPIAVGEGKKGKLIMSLKSLSMMNTSTAIPDIPVFILRLKDRDKFDNVIVQRDFIRPSTYLYTADHRGEHLRTFNKISLKAEYADNNIEYFIGNLESSLWNTERMSDISVSLEVSRSGFYCACIVPENVKKLKIVTDTSNSYGYLPVPRHNENKQLQYYLMISSVLTGLSLYSLFITRTTTNVIPFYIIQGVSIPTIIIAMIRFSFNFIANSIRLYESRGDPMFVKILDYCDDIIYMISRFVMLLIAMGMGSIYQSESATPSPDDSVPKLPGRLRGRAILLLASHFMSYCLRLLLVKHIRKLQHIFDFDNGVLKQQYVRAYFTVVALIETVDTIFPIIWILFALAYYFRTLRLIQRFEYRTHNEYSKPRKSFRNSILIVCIIPIVKVALLILLHFRQFDSTAKDLYFEDIPDDQLNYLLEEDEFKFFSQWPNTQLLWVKYLSSICTMCIVYFIWIKGSINSISKGKKQNVSHNHIPLSTFDERQI